MSSKRVLIYECDGCGQEEEFIDTDFATAFAELKDKGWVARKAAGDQWEHYCEECKS